MYFFVEVEKKLLLLQVLVLKTLKFLPLSVTSLCCRHVQTDKLPQCSLQSWVVMAYDIICTNRAVRGVINFI